MIGRIESKFVSDTVRVAVTQVALLVLNLLFLRLIQNGIGTEGLAKYLVARRIVLLLAPVLVAGLDIALARAVALEPKRGRSLLGLGLLTVSGTSLIALLVAVGVRDSGGSLAFGEHHQGALFAATVLFSAGYAFLALWYGALRGYQRMGLANALQIGYIVIEIATLAVVVAVPGLRANPVESLLVVSSLALLVVVVVGSALDGVELSLNTHGLSALIRYGVPRVPSVFLLAATLSVPVLFASNLISIRVAGLIGVGVAIVTAAETATVAVGTMLLPKLAALTRPGLEQELARAIQAALTFSIQVGIITSVVLPGVVGDAVAVWLGPGYRSGEALIGLLTLGAGPYLTYTILRNVLNAISEQPVVTWLTALAAGITVLGAGLTAAAGFGSQAVGPYALAGSLVAGLSLLGVGSVVLTIRMTRVSLNRREWPILGVVAIAALCLALIDGVSGHLPSAAAMTSRLVLRVAFVAAIGLMLWQWQTAWCMELADRSRDRWARKP